MNIVATVRLSSSFDLDKLAVALKGSEFCTSSARWLMVRLQPENHYIAFYKSGKFLIAGAKSQEDVEEISERVVSILKAIDIDVVKQKPIIHNVVMVGTIKMNVTLERVVLSLNSSKASYEPEQFSGLIYKDFGASLILFPGGKVIVAGAKSQRAGEEAADQFRKIIEDIQ